MRLKIAHRTEYHYEAPQHYALQRLRLTPRGGSAQTIINWSISIDGGRREVDFLDQYGNETWLVSAEGEPHLIAIEATGEVETRDVAGVWGAHDGFAPLWLFRRETTLTGLGQGISDLAMSLGEGDDLERLHELMRTVSQRIRYEPGSTDAATLAEEALARGSGVCQDHAHVFIAAARHLEFPARYVSGYLMMDGEAEQTASHAWAEAHVDGLGWVGFDPANGISPDMRYVKIAVGRDYRESQPVSGIRMGQGDERLAVRVTVEQ